MTAWVVLTNMSDGVLSAVQHYNPDTDAPLSLSKSTNSSVGRQTAWRSTKGMSLSKKNLGSTLNWDDSPGVQPPSSDKGAGFGA
jgi:hypothetical protein